MSTTFRSLIVRLDDGQAVVHHHVRLFLVH